MAKPEREFSAVVGQKSMGTAGPEYIKKDLDKAFAMFDPNKTLPDGSPGGIGLDNMQQGAVNDEVIGNREIDDTQAPIGNIGFLSTLLNWIAYVLKSILGTSWRTTPAITLPQVKAHVDAPSPHTEHETKTGAQAKVDAHGDKKDNPHNVSAEQVGAIVSVDGVSNPGGNIDLVAGAGVDLTPDNVGKKITISAKNDSIIPGKHATTHGSGGSDPVTPASIGAATSKHATAHGSGGSDPITPASIGAETPAGAQSKANTAASAAESSAKAYTDTHSGKTTGIHGATSAATASKIMIRDAAGRAKVAAPSAADDIAQKGTVDAVQNSLSNGMLRPKNTMFAISGSEDSLAKESTANPAVVIAVDGCGINIPNYTQGCVIASQCVMNNVGFSIAGGYKDDIMRTPLPVNRKWHIFSNPGSNPTIQIATTLQSNATFGDYGEYFESHDGSEIPAGHIVALIGDKIRKANSQDEKYLGAISKTAGVVLGGAGFCWQGRFLRDEFGGIITQEILDPHWEPKEGQTEADRPTTTVEVENPEYNPEKEYTERAKRPEWHVVGMLGQIHVRVDNTVLEKGHVRSNDNGIGTRAENGWYVMKVTTPYKDDKGYGVALCLIK